MSTRALTDPNILAHELLGHFYLATRGKEANGPTVLKGSQIICQSIT